MSGLWLRPYMKRRKLAAGAVLFRKGDRADFLYMLASGRIELVEIGVVLEPGRVFGEISFFSPDQQRTLTARCIEPCQLLSIDGNTVRELFFQNPGFGFQVIGLVAGRLGADIRRLESALAAAGKPMLTPEVAAALGGAVVNKPQDAVLPAGASPAPAPQALP
jgi:CRP-like cAMP-binding protein